MTKAEVKAAQAETAQAYAAETAAYAAMAPYKLMAEGLHAVATDAIEMVRLMARATDIRPLPGIYFLVASDGEVVYVGQAANVMFRMVGHAEKTFRTVRMVEVSGPAERDRLERLFIQFLTPRYNVQQTAANHIRRRMGELEGLIYAAREVTV